MGISSGDKIKMNLFIDTNCSASSSCSSKLPPWDEVDRATRSNETIKIFMCCA